MIFRVLAALLIVLSQFSSMSASVRGCERSTPVQLPASGAGDDTTIDPTTLPGDGTHSNIEGVPCSTSGLLGTPSGVHAVPPTRRVQIALPTRALAEPSLPRPLRPPRA